MQSASRFLRSLTDVTKVGREANKLLHTRFGRRQFNPDGMNVLDEDWDNLIILDACRYDHFCEQATLPGRTERRESIGSATYHWVRGTFAERRLHDTVYVGANSWFLKLRDEIGAEVHTFVDLQHGGYDVEWVDEELNVVTPETVTRVAKEVAEQYPDKRLIIHYLQPHHPFIGTAGSAIFRHQSNSLIDVVAEADEATVADLREAYRENLSIVLDEVETLLDALRGRTVITADHGEMLGDRHDFVPTRDYGHHKGIFNGPTVDVPWHVKESDTRKEIVAEPPERTAVDMDRVDEQLRELGYVI
ncbi:hypothetical protein [Salinarchaeum laminariae]|uniref:hypothetical protein n=1 Tax=Salinarchaeum laminariae TaxID=869888 RepID=UPI0020BDF72C|nr:hypothetical protein [Salinarchaeum laminariae]